MGATSDRMDYVHEMTKRAASPSLAGAECVWCVEAKPSSNYVRL